jgi:LysM repeat protein
VQPGDSLSLIGSKFCVKIAALMAANGWMDANSVQLFAGQAIVIPAVGQ